MPRPVTYHDHDVLERATAVFWRQGYHRTSIRDLVSATGLQPGSLYAAFGGKRELFQRVLDRYHEQNLEDVRTQLRADTGPVERIRRFFDRLLQRCREDDDGRGCLMGNTILELACVDDELSRRANRMFEEIERAFLAVIEEARSKGDIPRHKDPARTACYLVMSIHGIRVYSRGSPDPARLRVLVDETLDAILGLER